MALKISMALAPAIFNSENFLSNFFTEGNPSPMSQVQQLKVQLHQIATEATSGAASLGAFKQRFAGNSAQVLALIQGSATKADADISELLDAAGRAVEQASEALLIAAQGCKSYADQI
ncbi:hypothetical protein ACIA49_07075 [Kribbella sp. NPDC051587]|uniref:hypothetical protein n=1 Tax=Kribbella sp. NPDC051587 TaxID=3364119 RepID=UPI00378ACB3D